MKKFTSISAVIIFSFFAVIPLCAQDRTVPINDTYLYDKTVLAIPSVGAPYEQNGFLIFTAQTGPRSVGIAFSYEKYQIIHPFQIRKTRDVKGDVTETLFFYVMERPCHITDIYYRLVVDGLWTIDPLNPSCYYDETDGIELSKITFNDPIKPETSAVPDDQVHFVYTGESGQKVRLTGTFTNWDSWIYEMQETRPGFYEFRLPLPPGKYYYNYVVGMTSLVDRTNPSRAYTSDGRISSVITVQ